MKVIVPIRCNKDMYVTIPQISNTTVQLTLLKAPLLVEGETRCSSTPAHRVSIPKSRRNTSAPVAAATMHVRVTARIKFIWGGGSKSAGLDIGWMPVEARPVSLV